MATNLKGRWDFGFNPQWTMRTKTGNVVCRHHPEHPLIRCGWCRKLRCTLCWGARRCDGCQHHVLARRERKSERLRRERRLRRQRRVDDGE